MRYFLFFLFPSFVWALNCQPLVDKYWETSEKVVKHFSKSDVKFTFQGKDYSYNFSDLFYDYWGFSLKGTQFYERSYSGKFFDMHVIFNKENPFSDLDKYLFIHQIFWNHPLTRLKKIGNAFTFEGEGSLIGVSLKDLGNFKTHPLPPAYKNLFNDYFSFLRTPYINEIGMSIADFNKLKRISESMKDRSYLFAKTNTELSIKKNVQNFPRFSGQKASELGALDITGGFIVVVSNSAMEKTPLEVLHNVSIPRYKSTFSDKESAIAEIGRLANTSPRELLKFAQLSAINLRFQDGNVEYLIVEGNKARWRLFRKFGFKKLDVKLPKKSYYADGSDYVLIVDIHEFLKKSFSL